MSLIHLRGDELSRALLEPTKSLFHLRDELITQTKQTFVSCNTTHKDHSVFYFTHPAANRLNFVLPTLFTFPPIPIHRYKQRFLPSGVYIERGRSVH